MNDKGDLQEAYEWVHSANGHSPVADRFRWSLVLMLRDVDKRLTALEDLIHEHEQLLRPVK